MELILTIAIGLTIWRFYKYFAHLKVEDKSRLYNSSSSPSSPAGISSSPFNSAAKQRVATEKRRIWIKYQDAEGRISERKIEIYQWDNDYLFAWCCLRNEPRTFRIDHIVQCEVLSEQFQAHPTIERYIREQLLPKNWSVKVPWAEWQRMAGVRPVSSIRVDTNVKDDSAYWTPPGKAIVVNGYRISKGGIYVGTGLRALNEFRGPEPALIDPKMPIDKPNLDKSGKNVSYWPSYSELAPASRAGYLEWLATGRQDGDVHVGYPFLFLYGLERRLLGNGSPLVHEKAELDFMHGEVSSLLSLFGKIDSFQRHAAEFLEILEVCRDKEGLYKTSPPMDRMGDFLPARVQVVISQLASSGTPLPMEWALSWALCHPEIRLRMPARRCRDEFKELFRLRYKDEFKDGVTIRPGKGVLKLPYRPASPSFGKEVIIQTSWPQVPALRTIPAKLMELVQRCTDELDAYSRYIGNRSSAETDLGSIALLPIELARQHQGRASLEFRAWIEERLSNSDTVIISGDALLARWGKQDRLSKADCVLLSQVLEKWQYGIEPDVRFSGPPIRRDGKVVLFRSHLGAPSTPSPEYAVATVLLHLGVMVAMADGMISIDEERRLEHQLEIALKMGASERQRLVAHLRWLSIEEPTFSGLSKRLEPMDDTQKAGLAQFLITLAGADGYVTAEEVEALSKVYSLLGFPRERVHTDLHGLSVPESMSQDGLVTVRPAERSRGEYRIPGLRDGKKNDGFKLDMEKVHAKFAETATVSAMLTTIFVDNDLPAVPHSQNTKSIGTLDSGHSQFLLALLEKETWERSALDELASSLNLMLDGALEMINEASFDAVGEAFWEGDDPIHINASIAKEMMTCRTSE